MQQETRASTRRVSKVGGVDVEVAVEVQGFPYSAVAWRAATLLFWDYSN